MPSASIQREPTREYIGVVERAEELRRLQNQARMRKSMLLFGPEGVGKSRLLRAFAEEQPLALYIGQTGSPREILMALLNAIRPLAKEATIPGNLDSLTTKSLKGVVQRALDMRPFLMVLDHLDGPSRVVTGMIKDLNYYGRTPVLFASRSPHMEDIGALRPFCALKSEQVELKNLPEPIALEFAHREAEKAGLWASNLEHALDSIAEWSDGNPGSILGMLKMACEPRYRMGDQIKVHILYVDYRMGRR